MCRCIQNDLYNRIGYSVPNLVRSSCSFRLLRTQRLFEIENMVPRSARRKPETRIFFANNAALEEISATKATLELRKNSNKWYDLIGERSRCQSGKIMIAARSTMAATVKLKQSCQFSHSRFVTRPTNPATIRTSIYKQIFG